jgi:tRNA (guanine-N7-)-methyltransferase
LLAHREKGIQSLISLGKELGDFDVIEVGSNRGRFLFQTAKKNPELRYLGIEMRKKWVRLALEDARDYMGQNLSYLIADARLALPILASRRSVRTLFVLYPDPWWKGRHHHRRVLDVPFLQLVSELLTEEGLFVIKTDVKGLYYSISDLVKEVGSLTIVPPWEWPEEREWGQSCREGKCMRDGTATYRVILRPA